MRLPCSISRSIDAVNSEPGAVRTEAPMLMAVSRGVKPLAAAMAPHSPEQPQRNILRTGGNDIPHRRAHEARSGRRRGDEHPLLPHLVQDIGAQMRVETGHPQNAGDILDAARCAAAARAERQGIESAQLVDASIRIQG